MHAMELNDYLARVGLGKAPAADVQGLGELQRAQRFTIPFENLDIPLGRGVRLTPEAVSVKLLTRRRGGYCFEQNQLFLRVLRAIGFAARPVLARVWLMAQGVPPRTHTLNLVAIDGREWIGDAGFGGSYTPPMPLDDGCEESTPDGARHRLRRDPDHGWMLSRDGGSGWTDLYSFLPDTVSDDELEAANRYTSTTPTTRFTTLRVVTIARPTGFDSLVDRRLSIQDGPWSTSREIATAAEYRALLLDMFGLRLTDQEVAQLGLFEP